MRWIGLLLTLVLTGLLIRMVFAKPDTADGRGASPVGSTLGAAAPDDFATNAKSASEHTRRQICLAACASDERTCKNLAADDEAAKGCAEKSAQCAQACP
jgi:hypothetical protein